MPSSDDHHDRQDVEKFSRLLKTDERWASLRESLQRDGFDLSRVLLASFYESEEGEEHGVLVTLTRKVISFTRLATGPSHEGGIGFAYQDLTSNAEAIEQYPQVTAALTMIDEGCLDGIV